MSLFRKLPGFERSPPGLERRILGQLPNALMAGTAIPLFCYLFAWYTPSPAAGTSVDKYLADVAILATAVVVTVWTAVFTLAIGCIVVTLMKGPAYVADQYPLSDADEPRSRARADKAEGGQDRRSED